MSTPTIVDVDAVDCVVEPKVWDFARRHAAEIDHHWAQKCAEKPAMFNGRVMLMHRGVVEARPQGGHLFRGAYLETDFKAFLAWRDFGFPDAGIRNGFGMAALCGADSGFLLGEMNHHTANAGQIYFASGTPDPSDVKGGRVDIEGSIRRELLEETGLSPDEVSFEDGVTLIMDPHRVAFMKRVRSPDSAEVLKARIEAFLSRDPQPELVCMHIIRRRAEIGPEVQTSCAAYLRTKLEN